MAAVLVACNKENNVDRNSPNYSLISESAGMEDEFVKVGIFDFESGSATWTITEEQIAEIKSELQKEHIFEVLIDVTFSLETVSGELVPCFNIYGSNKNGSQFDNVLIYTPLDIVGNDIVLGNPGGGSEIQSITVKCTSSNCQGCMPSPQGCTPCANNSGTCNQEATQTFETTWEQILRALGVIFGIGNIFI